jgi:hypothetical protein
MTCATTNAVAEPQKTVQEIMEAIDVALAAPQPIGSIMGMPVYVDGKLPDRMIEMRSGTQVVRFRADHPYIDGTKLATISRS